MNGPICLSDYAKGLNHNHQCSYIDKIKVDPYLILSENFTSFIQNLTFSTMTFIITTTPSHTGERLKSYKSLETYTFFTAGWKCCKHGQSQMHNLSLLSKSRNSGYLLRMKWSLQIRLALVGCQPSRFTAAIHQDLRSGSVGKR
ncbi:uncharacterized protein LOC143234808 [Tachypleus tridentatus]|uniref:uncharacterized protein LOC143234808 n=1 Tax=Tachypleus tridentatus TaxID=6853 RepID=UPI003FD61CD1